MEIALSAGVAGVVSQKRPRDDTAPSAASKRARLLEGFLSRLTPEILAAVLKQCSATSLGRLEQTSRLFAPPPSLSVVQRAVRDKMREEYRGAELQVRSWPTQLLKHERAQTAAQGWDFVQLSDSAISAVELSDEDGWVKSERIGASLAKVVAKMRQSSSDGGSSGG